MRNLTIALLMFSLAGALAGCTHTIDGSEEFGRQMPQYQYDDDNPTPAYMHPGDSDPMSP
jgi:hypothetical protein